MSTQGPLPPFASQFLDQILTALSTRPPVSAFVATVTLLAVVPLAGYRHYESKEPATWGSDREVTKKARWYRNASAIGVCMLAMQAISTAGVAPLVFNSLLVVFAIPFLFCFAKGIL